MQAFFTIKIKKIGRAKHWTRKARFHAGRGGVLEQKHRPRMRADRRAST